MSEWQSADTKVRTRRHVSTYTRVGARMVLILDACVSDLPRLLPALEAARDGIGSSFGGGGTSGGDVSNPTASRAEALLEGHEDRAAADLDTVGVLLNRIFTDVAHLDRIRKQLAGAKPVARECENTNGCPAHNPPAAGRGGRCEACSRYLVRNKVDRTEVGGTRAA